MYIMGSLCNCNLKLPTTSRVHTRTHDMHVHVTEMRSTDIFFTEPCTVSYVMSRTMVVMEKWNQLKAEKVVSLAIPRVKEKLTTG